MKRTLTILTFLAAIPAYADTTVTINISNIATGDGQLVVTAYDSKKTWLKKAAVQQAHDLDGNTEDVTLELSLPAGDYAFQVFHDVDDNGKLKTSFIGIPKEPTGVSNNAKGRFGPPKFKDAFVSIGDDPVAVPLQLVKIK